MRDRFLAGRQIKQSIQRKTLIHRIEDWHKRMSEELNSAPAYIFPQTIAIIKEMKQVIDKK